MIGDWHTPVLADTVAALAAGAHRVVDGTVGDGGHTARFLVTAAAVLAVDRDSDALRRAQARIGEAAVTWLHGSFGEEAVLESVRRFRPDFILLDLGVSSHQLEDTFRGFSFRPGTPLDMRMGRAQRTAAEILNTAPQRELERLFREYGDERRAAKLARIVARRRGGQRFLVSDDFVNAIREALGPRSGPSEFARLFQALRIAVNDELATLASALPELRDALPPRGRLAVISYHSGEDRVVKQTLREWTRACVCPPHQPVCTCRGRPLGRLDPPKPVRPSDAEIDRNPRARSAVLRGFVNADGG
jgi:16S rRNA (cytosine1402-N4)-methyltransferase